MKPASSVGLLQVALMCVPGACLAGDPDARATESLAYNCYTCHGTDGNSPGDVPKLQGHSAETIAALMRGFKQGEGAPTIMDRIARGYTDQEIERIAEMIANPK